MAAAVGRRYSVFMRRIAAILVVTVIVSVRAFGGDSWPQFRGADNGRSDAKDVPLKWGEKENVKWKTAVHGKAWSSPVVMGEQIWMTAATADGHELFAVCLDRNSGKIVHDL